MTPRSVPTTLRRNMQQIVHYATQALAVHENKEDPIHCIADLKRVRELSDLVLEVLVPIESMASDLFVDASALAKEVSSDRSTNDR